MAFRIHDVRVDGNCYFRCVARLALADADVRAAFFIGSSDSDSDSASDSDSRRQVRSGTNKTSNKPSQNDENRAVKAIRAYVALSVRTERPVQQALASLVRLSAECREVAEDHPILADVQSLRLLPNNTDEKDLADHVADVIEHTSTMASSFEHGIVHARLSGVSYDAAPDLHVVILKRSTRDDKETLQDKFLRELDAALARVDAGRVAIFVNEDNVHYKYMSFRGSLIVPTKDLRAHVQERMASDSESD